VSEFRLYHHARAEASALAQVLSAMPEVASAQVAGSVRRRREVIRDLDFVVETRGVPTPLFERLGSVQGVTEYVGKTETSATLRFASGTVVEIFATGADQLGFQLVRSTGSVGHVQALAERARGLGLAWTDGGLLRDGKALRLPDEPSVYQAL